MKACNSKTTVLTEQNVLVPPKQSFVMHGHGPEVNSPQVFPFHEVVSSSAI